MANTLTAILPTIYEAADIVSRELVGFIPAVYRNSRAARAAVNQSVTYPITPAMTSANITASNTLPAGTDQTITSDSITITKSKGVSWPWTGEEQIALSNGDVPQGSNILRDQFAQAMRTLVNEVESDIFTAAYKGASRAYGTAGAAPFGTASDLSDFAGVLRILDDNGAPTSDRHLVVGAAAMANLRGKQSVLFKVNEAGTSDFLRRGILGEVMGLMIHNSYPITAITKGTGASYLVNNASNYAVGATTIAADTGSGTILQGDIVTFAGDSNKYVVGTALSAGSLALNGPGLLAALADNTAITVGNNYTPNVAFDRNAIHLVTRAPAMPAGGDAADDVQDVTDPTSGLTFQVAVYRERRQVVYEVGAAWGVKVVAPRHVATLIG